MYRLQFPPVPRRPQIQRVTQAEIRRLSRRTEDRGYFDHQGSFNVPSGTAGRERLVVSFTPTIYIATELSQPEQAEVEAHERLHFNDFRGLANGLRRNLGPAVRTMQWDQLRLGWQWFLYDVLYAAYELHRQLRRGDAFMPRRPSSPRPF